MGWACELFAGLVSHWEKRNAETVHQYDPAKIDRDLMAELYDKYGNARNPSRITNR